MIGLGIVIAIIAAVVWLWRRYVYRTERLLAWQEPGHVHRPIVVADGTVDVCESCGEGMVTK